MPGEATAPAVGEKSYSERVVLMHESKKVSIEHLDLPPGYCTELKETEVYLRDPNGRLVMKLPDEMVSAGHWRAEYPDHPREQTLAASQELCRALLVQLSQQTAECEMLCDRVAVLGEQLKAAEEERDQANAIAEILYDDYFREHLRIAAARRKRQKVEALGGSRQVAAEKSC
jgi:hypothetical protein